jgi:hypothetical protein
MSVISAPVNDRPVGFHAHDLEAFRLVLPPRLIGSPFVVYDGAQSRPESLESLSRPIVNWPGLLRELTRLTTYAPASQKAGRRCDRANNEKGFWMWQGVHRGT